MAVLELVTLAPRLDGRPDRRTDPPAGRAGAPRRRRSRGTANVGRAERPRRISDDLAWLRQAYDEPEEHGLSGLEDTAAVAAWETDQEAQERLTRLRDRKVLDAAGFLLHEEERIPV